jgi:hypothetical protein
MGVARPMLLMPSRHEGADASERSLQNTLATNAQCVRIVRLRNQSHCRVADGFTTVERRIQWRKDTSKTNASTGHSSGKGCRNPVPRRSPTPRAPPSAAASALTRRLAPPLVAQSRAAPGRRRRPPDERVAAQGRTRALANIEMATIRHAVPHNSKAPRHSVDPMHPLGSAHTQRLLGRVARPQPPIAARSRFVARRRFSARGAVKATG